MSSSASATSVDTSGLPIGTIRTTGGTLLEEKVLPILHHPIQQVYTSGNETTTIGSSCGNYMIMIHKLYVERLQSYLLQRWHCDASKNDNASSASSSLWTTITTAATTSHVTQPILETTDHQHGVDGTDDAANHNHHHSTPPHPFTFQIVDTPKVTGVSQARRGYVLLYIQATSTNTTTSITKTTPPQQLVRQYFHDVSPMIRQNISWIYPIQYQSTITVVSKTSNSDGNVHDTCQQIGTMIWSTLLASSPAIPSPASPTTTGSHNRNSSSSSITNGNVLLRVDCYPKDISYLEGICQQLQHHCASSTEPSCNITPEIQKGSGDNSTLCRGSNDPFDGPIPMTMSKSKCTHKLTIIMIHQNTEATDKMDVYWGIECRPGSSSSSNDRLIMEIPLNHEAADEIMVAPGIEQQHRDQHGDVIVRMPHKRRITVPKIIHADTSGDSGTAATTIVPLSRAYYKLHEIWYTYLHPRQGNVTLLTPPPMDANRVTSAIDLGAAPGGWTQVLLNHMNVTYVLAIDRAQLASPDRFIPSPSSSQVSESHIPLQKHIFHVPTTIENLNLQDYYENCQQQRQHNINDDTNVVSNNGSTNDDAKLIPPKLFSYLVCDASVQWNVLLPMITHQLQLEINKNIIQWTIPSVVIITLKLPFKTIHSIRRHILDIQKQVPNFIQTLSMTMYGNDKAATVSSNYRIIHCMANSDSERTLLVTFESP